MVPSSSTADQVLSLKERNEHLNEERKILREVMMKLTQENSALRDDNRDLSAQNTAYLHQISQLQSKRKHGQHLVHILETTTGNNAGGDSNHSSETNSTSIEQFSKEDDQLVIEELHQTVEELQHRIMNLVEEKLSMHNLIEGLEHQLQIVMNGGPSGKSSADTRTEKQEEKTERARKQKLKHSLAEDKPIKNTKGSGRIGRMGSMFSDRSRRNDDDDGDPRHGPAVREFDIRQDLEHHQMHRRSISGSAGHIIMDEQRSYDDRASWDRMKNDQDNLSGMFGTLGAENDDAGGTQSRFLQKAIDHKQRQSQDKRRTSSWVDRFGILGSNSTEYTGALPPYTVEDQHTIRRPSEGDTNAGGNFMMIDERRRGSEEGTFGIDMSDVHDYDEKASTYNEGKKTESTATHIDLLL
jgi:hypothetical protein